MKQTIVKRIAALTLFILTATLLGTLRADAPVQNSAAQTSPELSWPRAKLLDPSFKWQKLSGVAVAKECLRIGRFDPKDPTAMHFLYAIDLLGERFVAALPEVGTWNFRTILKEAGYNSQIPIPDKHVLLGGQQAVQPDRNILGYVKRSGKNLRLILISYNDDIGVRTASNGQPPAPLMDEVFVSNITLLDEILKEPHR